MNNKSIIIPIIFLIIGLVAVSGCISTNGNNTTSIKNYTGNGLSVNYPSDWTIHNDTEGMLLFFKNSGTNTQLTIQTILQSSPDLSDESLIPPIGNITVVTNTSRTIDNTTAKELTYKSDLLMYGTTYFEKNGKTFIINYQAPINDFKNETANFDIIINSIKVQ
jgi:hypothetical protein